MSPINLKTLFVWCSHNTQDNTFVAEQTENIDSYCHMMSTMTITSVGSSVLKCNPSASITAKNNFLLRRLLVSYINKLIDVGDLLVRRSANSYHSNTQPETVSCYQFSCNLS